MLAQLVLALGQGVEHAVELGAQQRGLVGALEAHAALGLALAHGVDGVLDGAEATREPARHPPGQQQPQCPSRQHIDQAAEAERAQRGLGTALVDADAHPAHLARVEHRRHGHVHQGRVAAQPMHAGLGRQVAIKVTRETAEVTELPERLAREAATIARMSGSLWPS